MRTLCFPLHFLKWFKLLLCPRERFPHTQLLRITTPGTVVNSKVCHSHTEVLNRGASLLPLAFTGGLMITELSSGLCQVCSPREVSERGNNGSRRYANCPACCKSPSAENREDFQDSWKENCKLRNHNFIGYRITLQSLTVQMLPKGREVLGAPVQCCEMHCLTPAF